MCFMLTKDDDRISKDGTIDSAEDYVEGYDDIKIFM